jgi:hypothetical protein
VSAEVQDRYGGLFMGCRSGMAAMHDAFRLSHMLLYGVLLGLYIGKATRCMLLPFGRAGFNAASKTAAGC